MIENYIKYARIDVNDIVITCTWPSKNGNLIATQDKGHSKSIVQYFIITWSVAAVLCIGVQTSFTFFNCLCLFTLHNTIDTYTHILYCVSNLGSQTLNVL